MEGQVLATGSPVPVPKRRGRPPKVRPDRTFVAHDRTYMTPAQRQATEQRIKGLEHTINNIGIDKTPDPRNPYVYNPTSVNVGDLRKEINTTKRNMEKHNPKEVDSKTKDMLWKRAKELERLIQDGMPTFDEMKGNRRIHPDTGKVFYETNSYNVDKNIAWEHKNAGNVREWKQIMRTLEPDDPKIANVERLRKGH